MITPNPKTSAAHAGTIWRPGDVLKQPGGNKAKACAYFDELHKHVPVLDTDAPRARPTFANASSASDVNASPAAVCLIR